MSIVICKDRSDLFDTWTRPESSSNIMGDRENDLTCLGEVKQKNKIAAAVAVQSWLGKVGG